MKILFKEKSGQSSAEMILLIGGIIVIVLIIGSNLLSILNSIGNSFKELLDVEKEYIMKKV